AAPRRCGRRRRRFRKTLATLSPTITLSPTLSQGRGSSRGGRKAGCDANVVADRAHIDDRRAQRLVEARPFGEREESLRLVAEDQRRVIEDELVDHAGAKERAHELAAGLDRDLVEAALGEQPRNGGEVGLLAFACHANHFRAAIFERLAAPGVLADREDDRRL